MIFSTTTRFWLTLMGKTPRKTLAYSYSSIARANASFRLATDVARIWGNRMIIGVVMPRSATSSTTCFKATPRGAGAGETLRIGRALAISRSRLFLEAPRTSNRKERHSESLVRSPWSLVVGSPVLGQGTKDQGLRTRDSGPETLEAFRRADLKVALRGGKLDAAFPENLVDVGVDLTSSWPAGPPNA